MPEQESHQEKSAAETTVTSPKNPDFDLSTFELENCTFEVRYPFALLLWDKSGQLFKTVQERWPDISPISVDPRKIDFQTGNMRLTVEFEQTRIGTVDPEKSLEQFSKDANEFLRITAQFLGLTVYKRVGFRLVHFKEFKNKKSAAAAFFSLGLVKIPEGKKFEVDETPIEGHYGLRWESEKKGVLLNCRAETRILDVQPPPPAKRQGIPVVHKETSGIVVDVDYYTVAAVEVGQIDAAEWIKHAYHIISRDTRFVFER